MISWDFMDFGGLGGGPGVGCLTSCGDAVAPCGGRVLSLKKQYWHQISSIFIDFICFLMISWDFMDFGGLGGGPGVGCLTSCGDAVAACGGRVLSIKKEYWHQIS